PWAIRAFLTFAVPWAFATTLPAQALTSGIAWWVVAGAVAFAGAALFLLRILWNHAVRLYASASS
ncbi:MAG TPA: ABC-2 family transporter protein, partial [Thermomicrobiales bacterium]|nr:ABC-2 family transporter protein [Thermomicrobiales bacterium]